ncbi:adenosylcobinamide-GDP ribazoletransferase [Sphingopyxis sp. MWB1]|uniref:adenosylcobinamide-GDP ribazoletransferase n=1 Tax=Sphingopyxis sp. MWB1 TaxID=1537715 RepID=UPI00051A105C|nr:adenosylcobinamide-GDP ribazoletransferase [Sphingopyxis sp. MWB1]
MKGLIVAIQFLTRLPTPHLSVSGEEFAASMRWFPAVGLIVGSLVACGGWAGARIDPWTGALVALLLWVGITGALHLDGLGDVADAAGAAHKWAGDAARLRAVLEDPHMGSFGVCTLILQLCAKLILLHSLIALGTSHAYVAIALSAFGARIGPLVWSRWLPDLHEGLASKFRNVVRPIDLILWGLLLIVAATASPGLMLLPLFLFLWGWWLIRRLGGLSGDGHGAGIELVETALLFAALVFFQLA